MKQITYRIRPNERLVAGFVYIAALLPLWGILVIWVIREFNLRRCRHIVFHATQAVWLQVSFLTVFILFALIQMILTLIAQMGAETGGASNIITYAQQALNIVMITVAGLYALTCLVATWLILDGRAVSLPVLGRRIRSQENEINPAQKGV